MAVDKDASVAGGVVSNSQGRDGQNNDDLKNGMIKKLENKVFLHPSILQTDCRKCLLTI